MKHLNTFKSFSLNESINLGITEDHTLDLDRMILTVYYDPEGWDSRSEFIDSIKFAAKNENDTLTDELEEALSEYGLMIDTTQKHDYSREDGWVDYKIVKIDPMWVRIA